ncbi:MAG: hypothetical protein JWQ43_2180 [Glaciihabitans sp.]|nr:hypothetical protein [Glaciihabitans sp.]
MTADRTLLAGFLRARRELLQPEDVGLARDPHRRVPGLRREEVAQLAAISAEYYLRLEQGRDHQPSEQVLSALSKALQLNADARAYLYRLAYPSAGARRASDHVVSDSVLGLLAQWRHTPAYVSDRNHDVLAANDLARLMSPGRLVPGANLLLSAFDEDVPAHSQDDWAAAAGTLVGSLRLNADPFDPRLQEIIGELSVRNREFRRMWARHDVEPRTAGKTLTLIGLYGWVNLRWQALAVPGGSGHVLTTFFADPATVGDEAMRHLVERASALPEAADQPAGPLPLDSRSRVNA